MRVPLEIASDMSLKEGYASILLLQLLFSYTWTRFERLYLRRYKRWMVVQREGISLLVISFSCVEP